MTKPLKVKAKADTITLTRDQYEALIRRIEDAEDRLALTKQRDRETTLGKIAARADYLPADLVRRLLAGEHPVRI
jgi:hypothetical protein